MKEFFGVLTATVQLGPLSNIVMNESDEQNHNEFNSDSNDGDKTLVADDDEHHPVLANQQPGETISDRSI
jgi:hypothetical protein